MPAKNYPVDLENGIDSRDANTESGYVSGGSSDDYTPEIVFTKPHLQFLNRQLQFLEPQGMFNIPGSSIPETPLLPKDHGLTQFSPIYRHPEMVHHITASPVPDHCLWLDWPCHP